LVNSSTLLKLLKVEPSEWPTFAQMLGHSFFNSLGIAFSFTAINVLLINLHGIELLPWIYLFGGIMVLLFGRLYAYLESRVHSVQLFAGVLLFCISWTLLARGLTMWGDTLFLLALLYALYLALYQLINLEFWGAAALIYDVRQSKRLFGLLSTGESVAKMGGYLVTPFIVSLASLSDLLFFAAASFGISFFFLFQLSRINKKALDVEHHHGSHSHKLRSGNGLVRGLKKLIPGIKDKYLRITGYFAMFSALVYYLVHYSFLNRVEVHFSNIEELAFFFGLFFGIGKGINLLIKVLLYSRIFNNMKIGIIILLFPLTIGTLAFAGLVGQFLVPDPLIFFLWVFGLIMLMDEVFRTSIYLPSFFVLFQPLKKHQRLEGHTIAKGYMEPIGMAIAGLIMVGLIWMNVFQLNLIIVFLTASAACWIGVGYLLSSKYREKVDHLLKNRLLTSSNIQLTVEEMEVLSNAKLDQTDPVTLLYRIKLLGNQMPYNQRNEILIHLLKSNREMILYETMSVVDEFPSELFWPYLIELMDHPNDAICKRASFIYCKHSQEDCLEVMDDIILANRGKRREYHLAAVLKYSGLYGAIQYGRLFLDLIEAEEPEQRLSAARIVGLMGREDYYHPLVTLIHDEDKGVRREAILACANVPNVRLIPELIKKYRDADVSRRTARAIEGFGPLALPPVKVELEKLYPKNDLLRFVKLLTRIKSEETGNLLFEYILHRDFEFRTVAIYGAFRNSSFTSGKDRISEIEDLLKFESEVFDLLKMHAKIKTEESGDTHLLSAIKDEMKQMKGRVLRLLGLIYDKHLIQKALDNLRGRDSFLRGNVLELLENEIKIKHCKMVIPVLEYKLSAVESDNLSDDGAAPGNFLNEIMKKQRVAVSEWTIALAVRCCRQNKLSMDSDIIKKLRNLQSEAITQELERKI